MKRLIFLLLTAIFSLASFADDYPKNTNIDIIEYRFELWLCDTTDRIKGEAEIHLSIKEGSTPDLFFDLIQEKNGKGMMVEEVCVGSKNIPYSHEKDRLFISYEDIPDHSQSFEIRIKYGGIPEDGLIISKNKHGDRCFFADNYPNRARYWIPCVDHLYDKARLLFKVHAPDHYKVVANGILKEESYSGDHEKLSVYYSEQDLPTKVMVIGVAPFAVEYTNSLSGIPVSSWVYYQDRINGFKEYAIATDIIDYYGRLIGPYGFGKLANVQSKTRYGGMENSGAVFYHEHSVSGTGRSEGLIAHELAHQWFGDAVTESEWDHIWLSEGFATYLTSVYWEHKKGKQELMKQMESARKRVIYYARRNPDARVVIRDPGDLRGILNTYSYQKGAWVLHMYRNRVGEEMFWKTLQRYYKRYKHLNASTADFVKIAEDVSGQGQDAFFKQWLYEAYHPMVSLKWKYSRAKQSIRLKISQAQKNFVFEFPLEIGIYDKNDTLIRIEKIYLEKKEDVFDIPMDEKPVKLVPDPNVKLLFESVDS